MVNFKPIALFRRIFKILTDIRNRLPQVKRDLEIGAVDARLEIEANEVNKENTTAYFFIG